MSKNKKKKKQMMMMMRLTGELFLNFALSGQEHEGLQQSQYRVVRAVVGPKANKSFRA